ncbi:MAG: AAA family ATPase [Chloroflexota bacterium]|nr:AAA family ATPase [Chloroflexota bacterium]
MQSLSCALGLTEVEQEELASAASGRNDASQVPSADSTPITAVRLPCPATALIGRERELGALGGLLEQGARLVTLTGPGGVGKTRLALQLAGDLSEMYPDGVAFAPLAPLADAGLVIATIARSLGLTETGGQSLRDTLHSYLRGKRMLLVLDNFEHVMVAAPEVAELVMSSGGVSMLVTSRAPLRLRGERECPLQPLKLPELTRVPEVREVESNPAVELFVERARAIAPGFRLSQANAAAVAAICRRLDGLPLAVELAAARIRAMSPTELLARLDSVLPLLRGGARDLPERQRTMQATIQWSYDLLGTQGQELFRRLSVFAGGWTLEGAEVVGSTPPVALEAVFDLLSELVEQSLVIATPGEVMRYRMLEPIRQYALRLLEESGQAEEVRERHARFYLALGEAAESELKGPDQVEWLERLGWEHDNLRAAMARLLDRGDTESAARMGWGLARFWWMRGHFSEGRRWMEMLLAQDPPPSARAWAQLTLGVLAYGQADYERAAPAIEESLVLYRRIGHERAITMATSMAGPVEIARKNYERGAALVEEALRRYHQEGDTWGGAVLITYFAAMPLSQGDFERATELSEKGLALSREIGDRISIYASLYNLASIAQARGDSREATRLFGEALVLSMEMGDLGNSAYCLEGLAGVSTAEGEMERAARLWGAAETLLATGEAAVYAHTPDRSLYERAVSDARSKASDQSFEAAWAEGRKMTAEQAVKYALAGPEPMPSVRPAVIAT